MNYICSLNEVCLLCYSSLAIKESSDTLSGNLRAARDIDIVLIVEAFDQGFITRFLEFVDAGQYEIRERATGKRELYRFSKPKDDTYPTMLELFTRQPGKIDLSQGQRVIPVEISAK